MLPIEGCYYQVRDGQHECPAEDGSRSSPGATVERAGRQAIEGKESPWPAQTVGWGATGRGTAVER